MHGEASATNCPSSRAYHDISSSSVRSPFGKGFAWLRARVEVEAGPFVIVGREWRRGHVAAGAGGYGW